MTPSPTTTTTPKLSAEDEEKKYLAIGEAMFERLAAEDAPRWMSEEVHKVVNTYCDKVFDSVAKQSQETAQSLQAFAEQTATVEALVRNEQLLRDELKAMQASIKQLREENQKLRDAMEAMQAKLPDPASDGEGGTSPGAAPAAPVGRL